jgi:hypothetical protein
VDQKSLNTGPSLSNDEFQHLLEAFAAIGEQARLLRDIHTPIGRAKMRGLKEQASLLIPKLTMLAAAINETDEFRQIFIAAAILATAALKDHELEKALTDFITDLFEGSDANAALDPPSF